MTRDTSEMSRLCRRFEIAIENFGRSCIDMQANEKCFQAWFGAAVIHEFGMSRVYREVHLVKRDLLEESERSPLASRIKKGNELFPDLSVSWEPDVDVRHSAARPDGIKQAAQMLAKFAIVSELKVTGSTSTHTSPSNVALDLAKLFVFARAQTVPGIEQEQRTLSTYMVLLDNARHPGSEKYKGHYSGQLKRVLDSVGKKWPDHVPVPTVALISPREGTAEVTFIRNLGR